MLSFTLDGPHRELPVPVWSSVHSPKAGWFHQQPELDPQGPSTPGERPAASPYPTLVCPPRHLTQSCPLWKRQPLQSLPGGGCGSPLLSDLLSSMRFALQPPYPHPHSLPTTPLTPGPDLCGGEQGLCSKTHQHQTRLLH